MVKEYTYKLQGDGRDSWTVVEKDDNGNIINKYMVYEKPEGFANTIEEALEVKKDQIDSRTQELIFEGFNYPSNSTNKWSLSINAQINWNNIPQLPQIVFPLEIQDMEGNNYNLEYSDRMNFYYTAVNIKNSHLQSGNILKTQVSQLTTIQEILTFVDPR